MANYLLAIRNHAGIAVLQRTRTIYQVNLWEGFGGSEVYTRFLSIALQSLGYRSVVFVCAKARHWDDLDFGDAQLVRLDKAEDIFEHLPRRDALIITNFPLGGAPGDRLKREHCVITFAHQPLYQKDLRPYGGSAMVVANSWHVLKSVVWAGLPCYRQPLYGVADIDRLKQCPAPETIVAASAYNWDRRKFRDLVYSWGEPVVRPVRSCWSAPRRYVKRKGLSIGIVSRIVTIKQFPRLFESLAPVIARHPNVWIEIFGSGGFASVRDIKRSLEPIRDRVRFWGQQKDVRPVYAGLDFLLAGLPEREGMGRNVIEAQLCGTPVLAVDAPPFSETVVHGKTGYLFADPRDDNGEDFGRLLSRILESGTKPNPFEAPAALRRFTQPTFNSSVERLLEVIAAKFGDRVGMVVENFADELIAPTASRLEAPSLRENRRHVA
jgi:glycosyltransferase involved in cell wall biosynthesis